MPLLERTVSPQRILGSERAFEVRFGSIGGVEVRPTRLFLWKGPERLEHEQVLPLADRPVGLDYERTESRLRVGSVEFRSRGNPLLTLAITGAMALKSWAGAPGSDVPQGK